MTLPALRPARSDAAAPRWRTAPALALLLASWAGTAMAVDQPSTYPGCATRNVTVAAGGSVRIDLSKCHSFGLGQLLRAPTQGTATPGDQAPVESYVYTHTGDASAEVLADQFVVLDDNSDWITINVTLPTRAAGITALPVTLGTLAAGQPYSQRIIASGGTAPYRVRIAAGRLPAGLALDPEGLISGTPTERGPFDFSLRLQDAAGATADRAYAGTVKPARLTVSPGGARALQGQPFSQGLAVSGGVAPHRFALEPGVSLPPGLSLSSRGEFSGRTDVSPGRFPVRVRVTDSSTGPGEHFEVKVFTLTVIGNADGLPAVSLAVSPAAVAEDEGVPLVYTLRLSAPSATPIVVNLVSGGTARTTGLTALTLPAGATRATFRIKPLADDRPEPDEVVIIAVAPGAGYVVGSPASASATLVNDDLP